ncbi:indolethylamine N-methyltransferase-like isoform X1 [Aquarana catesbeiana]|uniref:indolethylamine N-methyltransferase-like isoform X1 n=1 Tax=Aquarana catesbeiana TaxID=8400 RepID=UPI003CCA2C17
MIEGGTMAAHADAAAGCSVQQCERMTVCYEREELLAICCRQKNAVCAMEGQDYALVPWVSCPAPLYALLGALPEIQHFGKCAETAIDAMAAAAELTGKQEKHWRKSKQAKQWRCSTLKLPLESSGLAECAEAAVKTSKGTVGGADVFLGRHRRKWRYRKQKRGCIKGDLLIDFGGGPTIYQLLSACEVFKNIISSDFVENNRAEVEKWLRKDPDAFDWTPIVKMVCELEGNSDSESCKKKEEKLRRTVTKVLTCDALKKNPFEPVKMPQADCIISCLCLETPCKDVETFTNALRNLKALIKPGGHIVIQSVLNCSYYYVGKKRFFCLAITKEELEKAYRDAGYEIVKLKAIPLTEKLSLDLTDENGYYFIHARKPCS